MTFFRKLLSLFIAALLFQPTLAVLDKVALSCPDQETVECLAGGVFSLDGVASKAFSGTYMCREYSSLFGWLGEYNNTVCVPTVLNTILGEDGDVCGCCGGNCPKPCQCPCSYEGDFVDKVLVKHTTGIFVTHEEYECVSKGQASRWVADDWENYQCVSMEECPTLEPTASPTEEPLFTTTTEPPV